MNDKIKETILEILNLPPSKEALLQLISWIDKECYGKKTDETIGFQILARTVEPVGKLLLPTLPQISNGNIISTMKAAQEYVQSPTEDNWSKIYLASTASYPFGPGGEGCYAVAGIGYAKCEPGSGCISGAGFLARDNSGLDEKAVFIAVRDELLLWINESKSEA